MIKYFLVIYILTNDMQNDNQIHLSKIFSNFVTKAIQVNFKYSVIAFVFTFGVTLNDPFFLQNCAYMRVHNMCIKKLKMLKNYKNRYIFLFLRECLYEIKFCPILIFYLFI